MYKGLLLLLFPPFASCSCSCSSSSSSSSFFYLLTTFGDVFLGGRSHHSSNMFELLIQKNSVVETIKKPTPRRVHAYWVPTGEGRLTTFGDVFGGGRSQHSSNMFELLTQKNSVVETIKKPTHRRVHAYWVPTGEGRLTTFGDVFWGGRSQHSSDMFELLTQKSSVAENIKKT